MKWITPPECQGQIVEASYASDGERAYRRTTDHSDRTSVTRSFAWSDYWDALDEDDEGLEWEPWNCEPSIPDELWGEPE